MTALRRQRLLETKCVRKGANGRGDEMGRRRGGFLRTGRHPVSRSETPVPARLKARLRVCALLLHIKGRPKFGIHPLFKWPLPRPEVSDPKLQVSDPKCKFGSRPFKPARLEHQTKVRLSLPPKPYVFGRVCLVGCRRKGVAAAAARQNDSLAAASAARDKICT